MNVPKGINKVINRTIIDGKKDLNIADLKSDINLI